MIAFDDFPVSGWVVDGGQPVYQQGCLSSGTKGVLMHRVTETFGANQYGRITLHAGFAWANCGGLQVAILRQPSNECYGVMYLPVAMNTTPAGYSIKHDGIVNAPVIANRNDLPAPGPLDVLEARSVNGDCVALLNGVEILRVRMPTTLTSGVGRVAISGTSPAALQPPVPTLIDRWEGGDL